MTPIHEGVILMAGEGSRLRQGYSGRARLPGSEKSFLKPFVPVGGRPLISYTLDALVHGGITALHFVVGYEKERVIEQVKRLVPSGVTPSFIENREWKKQNGVSLLAAATHVTSPFLLTMCDHVFEKTIIDLLLGSFAPGFLNVAVDRKLDSIFDLDDAMKVRTRGNEIVEIGKTLRNYDAIDIGVFVCPLEIFDYLKQAMSLNSQHDCSLADGIRLMARDNKVRAIDIGESWWQDVDTPEMLQHAEEQIAKKMQTAAA